MYGFGRGWPGISRPDILALVAAILVSQHVVPMPAIGYSVQKAKFAVRCKGEVLPYLVNSVFVLPGETLTVETPGTEGGKGQQVLQVPIGEVAQIAINKWSWRVPRAAGLYPIKVIHPQSSDSVIVNVFVMVPYNQLKGECLNGYRIGNYPTIPLKQLPVYKPPEGFIEVTKENEETFVTPHFRLNQFLCKQDGGYPKYVVLGERLLLKLESILEKLNERGLGCDTLHIMSGYRTPYYNKCIGNGRYSCHLWGNAADIFIDENPKDGMMDDLNKDGKIDYRDADVVYNIIDEMYGKPFQGLFIGGLARYRSTNSHGPFVHVDVRGFRARW